MDEILDKDYWDSFPDTEEKKTTALVEEPVEFEDNLDLEGIDFESMFKQENMLETMNELMKALKDVDTSKMNTEDFQDHEEHVKSMEELMQCVESNDPTKMTELLSKVTNDSSCPQM